MADRMYTACQTHINPHSLTNTYFYTSHSHSIPHGHGQQSALVRNKSFLYNGSKVIFFEPISLDGKLPQADLILVTHAHNDHWSVVDFKKIIGPNTIWIIGPIVSN